MGAGQSSPSQTPPRALHVLRVTPSSPASLTSIEPFFDFVVGFEGDSISAHKSIDAAELERIVEGHEGRELQLLVWNSKSQQTRVVPITPSRDWSLPRPKIPDPQEPEAERKPSLLGLSMRMCRPELALDNVWHVLDVLEGSPAESAGLVPYGDWIIGWSGGVLSAEGDFYDIVEAHIDKPLRVYVYSYDFDTIREVVLVPNRQWGGEGLLGCVFGFGLLHRIPPLPEGKEPGSIPPELEQEYDDSEYEDQQLFVPADLHGEPEFDQTEEQLQWERYEWAREAHAPTQGYDASPPNGTYSSEYYTHSLHEHENGHAHQEDADADDTSPGEDETTPATTFDSPSGLQRPSPNLTPHRERTTPPLAAAPLQSASHSQMGSSPPAAISPKPLRVPPSRSNTATSSPPRTSTPTQNHPLTPSSRPLGIHMNGIALGSRSASFGSRNSMNFFDLGHLDDTRNVSVMRAGAIEEDDHNSDGTSVAGTDVTSTSEVSLATSTGSLTSID